MVKNLSWDVLRAKPMAAFFNDNEEFEEEILTLLIQQCNYRNSQENRVATY